MNSGSYWIVASFVVAGCAFSGERKAPPPLAPDPVTDERVVALAPALGSVVVVAAGATSAAGPLTIAGDASLLTGKVAADYLAMQKIGVAHGCDLAASVDVKAAQTQGVGDAWGFSRGGIGLFRARGHGAARCRATGRARRQRSRHLFAGGNGERRRFLR